MKGDGHLRGRSPDLRYPGNDPLELKGLVLKREGVLAERDLKIGRQGPSLLLLHALKGPADLDGAGEGEGGQVLFKDSGDHVKGLARHKAGFQDVQKKGAPGLQLRLSCALNCQDVREIQGDGGDLQDSLSHVQAGPGGEREVGTRPPALHLEGLYGQQAISMEVMDFGLRADLFHVSPRGMEHCLLRCNVSFEDGIDQGDGAVGSND